MSNEQNDNPNDKPQERDNKKETTEEVPSAFKPLEVVDFSEDYPLKKGDDNKQSTDK